MSAAFTNLTIDGQDERVILNVRNSRYVKLVFDGMTVGIRFEDGVVYTYTEINGGFKSDTEKSQASTEIETSTEIDEESDDCDTLTETEVESQVSTTSIRQWAGGGFTQINEQHEFNIEQSFPWVDDVYEEETQDIC
jgi:tyrosine-protein phosphatase YwqE